MKHLVLLTALFSCAVPGAWAQSFCASDGQPQPVQLMERFINANCETCWTDPATPQPGPRALALDWVLPGSRGDDAPLSTVAARDALARLEALGQGLPEKTHNRTHAVKGLKGTTLRPIEEVRAPHAHTVAVDPRTHRVYLPLENIGGRPVLRIYEASR